MANRTSFALILATLLGCDTVVLAATMTGCGHDKLPFNGSTEEEDGSAGSDSIGSDSDVGSTDGVMPDLGSDPTIGLCTGFFADIECVDGACVGRITGTEAWTTVLSSEEVDSWPEVPISTVFDCGQDSIDGCGTVDVNGHIACWAIEGECARVAVPRCMIAGSATMTEYWPDWMPCDVGEPIGAQALCTDSFCWIDLDPTSAIHPNC